MNEKDPRAVRTKNLIKESFAYLLEEKDFKYITVNDITTKATINRATFYAHYTDKHILLEEFIIDCFGEMIPLEISNAISLNENIVREFILFLYKYNVYFYQKCKIDSTSIAPYVDNLLKDIIENLIEKILINMADRGELDYRDINLLVKIIGSSIYSCARYCYLNKENEDRELIIKKTLNFIMHGIKGIK